MQTMPLTAEPQPAQSQHMAPIPEAATRPILVTGAHRSGTTWVGKILAATSETAYISEPLNVHHRPGVLDAPVERWYTYIHPGNEAIYLPAYRKLLRLEYGLGRELKALHSRKDLLRMMRDAWIFEWGKLGGARPLIKDPFAVFSLGWFIERLGCQVIVTIRHPAAFASSLKRLDWPFELVDLLQQPQLIQDWLEPYRAEMELAPQNQGDLLWQAALLWRMVYSVVEEYQAIYPEIRVVRHEELSLDPVGGFQSLYEHTHLTFNKKAKQTILTTSSADNPEELQRQTAHSIRLDSRANLGNWKKRLEPGEIDRLRRMTESVAQHYYQAEDWQ